MSFAGSFPNNDDSFPASERRNNARQAPRSLSYVRLDESNGGILLNISEGGLAVQAAMSVMDDTLPRVRLQVAQSKNWLEVGGQVSWTGDSRRLVGVQFVGLPEESRLQIREWIAAESRAHSEDLTAPAIFPEHDAHAQPVEIAPRRIARAVTPSAAPVSKDMSRAALLSASLAAAAPQRAVLSVPGAAPGKISEPPKAVAAETKGSSWGPLYVPLVAGLALLSLAAGWEAGRGNALAPIVALFQPAAVAPVASANASATPDGGVTATNFEVVDANNQSWIVPFSGPENTLPQASTASPTAPKQTPSETSNAPVFQTRALSAPKPTLRLGATSPSAAPSLPMAPQNAGAALPEAIAGNSGQANLAPPPASSNLAPATLITRVDPTYPADAVNRRIEGAVQIHAHVNVDGTVSNVAVISGPAILAPAAVEAVQKWRYKPEVLDGHTVAGDINVNIVFKLPDSSR